LSPYVRCAGIVLGIFCAFSIIWKMFLLTINPHLAAVAESEGRKLPAFHGFTVGVIEFGRSYSLWYLWSIAAFAMLCWVSQKKGSQPSARRLVISVYAAPFAVITLLLIAACFA
jgi:type II secretory pathway component PulF